MLHQREGVRGAANEGMVPHQFLEALVCLVLDLGHQSSVNPQVSCMNDRSQKQAEYRSHKLSH